MEMEMEMEMAGFVGLRVITNVGTSFALAAVRKHTFAQLKGLLKELHFCQFPEWGDIKIAALMIEVFQRKYHIVDSTFVGDIYNQPEGTLELLVASEHVDSRAVPFCPVQRGLPFNDCTNSSNDISMLRAEKDLLIATPGSDVILEEPRSFSELCACESLDLRLSLSSNKLVQRIAEDLSKIEIKALDDIVHDKPLMNDKTSNASATTSMKHTSYSGKLCAENRNSTPDGQIECRKVDEQLAYAPNFSSRVLIANGENAKCSQDEVNILDRGPSTTAKDNDHDNGLPTLGVKQEDCTTVRQMFGTIINYTSHKEQTVAATVELCQNTFDLHPTKGPDSIANSGKIKDNLSRNSLSGLQENNFQGMYERRLKKSTPLRIHVDEQRSIIRDLENLVANSRDISTSFEVKGASGTKMDADDDNEARVMTSDCMGVVGDRFKRRTSLRQNCFIGGINIKSQLASAKKVVSEPLIHANIHSRHKSETENCNSSDTLSNDGPQKFNFLNIREAITRDLCHANLSNHTEGSLQTSNSCEKNTGKCMQFEEFRDSNPHNNCVQEIILSDNCRGSLNLENSVDSVLQKQKDHGWKSSPRFETGSLKEKNNPKKIERNKIRANESQTTSIKEPDLASTCCKKINLEQNQKADSSADSPDKFTHKNQILKSKRVKCVPPGEAVILFNDGFEERKWYARNIKNQSSNIEVEIVPTMGRKEAFLTNSTVSTCDVQNVSKTLQDKILTECWRSPDLRGMGMIDSTVVNDNTADLDKDSGHNTPPDTYTLIGGGKKRKSSHMRGNQFTGESGISSGVALQSTCQAMSEAETGILTHVSSLPLKSYTGAVAASASHEISDLEAPQCSDSYARRGVMKQKHKKSKAKKKLQVNEPNLSSEHSTLVSMCNNRAFAEENTQLKHQNKSKVGRERKYARALLRASFIRFPKLVSSMACPIQRHKVSKA